MSEDGYEVLSSEDVFFARHEYAENSQGSQVRLAEEMLVFLSSAISLERLSQRHATHEGIEGPEFSSGLRNARKRDLRSSENDDVDD